MQPINYLQNVADPFAQVLSGLKIGATMADMDAARETQRLAAEKQQAELQRINQYQTGVNKVLANPNRTWSDWEPLLAIAPNKDQIEAIKLMGDRSDARVKKSQQNFVANVLLSLEQNPEVAKEILDERIQAEPDPQQQQLYQTIRKAVDISPEKAAQITELGGAALFGEDWYKGIVNVRQERRAAAEAPSKLEEAKGKAREATAKAQVAFETAPDEIAKAKALRQYEQAKATTAAVEAKYAEQTAAAELKKKTADLEKIGWDVKNLKSQISDRAERLNLDRQTTTATVNEKLSSIQKNLSDIPADTRKLINESATLAATSKQSAEQFNDLAKRIESQGGNYGVASSASDFLKKIGGFQGGMTQLKQEYTRLRNTAAIKTLPPGPATDKDIAMALSGFPSDTANAGDLARFLRGMAKLQDVDASINNAKTDWLAQNNGTLTRAKNTFVAGDYATKPGETFNDFAQRIVGDVSKRYDPTQQTNLVDQIPTDRNPAPAQNNIRSQADAILRGGK